MSAYITLMKLIISYGEIFSRGRWAQFCEDKGISEDAIYDGWLDASDTIELTKEEAIRYKVLHKLLY